MIFSYSWLQSFFDEELPGAEKLADILTIRSFEVRAIRHIKLLSGEPDVALDIDILPNRAHDCLSHLGVAKEIAAIFGLRLRSWSKLKLNILKQKQEDFLKIDIQDKFLCRRYLAGIMLDIKVGPSPKWMQDRLFAVGQKPINNIVDAGNYAMLEIGQPLHAFDFDKVSGQKNRKSIIARRANQGERIITLDNREFILDENVLVIADEGEVLAIAGVKGGKKAEIDKKTKNIILEAANFEPSNIRQTSRKLDLRTGASVGFENDISPTLAPLAMDRFIKLIRETGGGMVAANRIDFYRKKIKNNRVDLRVGDISRLIGCKIPEKKIISILEALGFVFEKNKGSLLVLTPAERLDLVSKEDIIEEIVRIFGYEKIQPKMPDVQLRPINRNDGFFYGSAIRDILTGAGFSEVYRYSFAPSGDIEVANPIAGDKKYLRNNLLDGLTGGAAYNLKHFDHVKLFEIGKVFKSDGDIEEENILAGIVARKNSKEVKKDFFEIKGIVEMLLSSLGIADFYFSEQIVETKINLPYVEIKIDSEAIGKIVGGGFEINLDRLVNFARIEAEYRPVSKYPAVIRDIAVIIPAETRMADVCDVIENSGGDLLIDVDLFDVYEGEGVGESKKSFAFHLIFQSGEKTLNDKEVNALMEKIIKCLEEDSNWEVRKN